jgi:hypothetical protein
MPVKLGLVTVGYEKGAAEHLNAMLFGLIWAKKWEDQMATLSSCSIKV